MSEDSSRHGKKIRPSNGPLTLEEFENAIEESKTVGPIEIWVYFSYSGELGRLKTKRFIEPSSRVSIDSYGQTCVHYSYGGHMPGAGIRFENIKIFRNYWLAYAYELRHKPRR